MSVLPDFDHRRPRTLADALDLISFESPPYSGGTEILLAMRAGLLRPTTLVDLKRVAELQGICSADGYLALGGAVTHQEASDDTILQQDFPALAATLNRVGNPRVRAAGTLAGNLCFAEPKSDVATILIALEADLELRSRDKSRMVAASDFIVGPYSTVREHDEILTSIRLADRRGRPAVYTKYQTMERPTVGVAAAVTLTGRCRVVVGAVGGAPELFEADTPSAIDPREVAETVEVIPDLTGSEAYKRHIVDLHVGRALSDLGEAV